MLTLSNPELKTIKPDYAGNLIKDGRFLNYEKVRAPKLKEILKWQFGRNSKVIKEDKCRLEVFLEDTMLLREINKIVWLGHASFLITLNGKNILVDPVFANIPMVKRRSKIPFRLGDYDTIDYILISHAHFDHLDKKTLVALTRLNPDSRIYCGLQTLPLLHKWKIKNKIVEAGWYQQFPLLDDEIEFYFMPALHWSKRSLKDRNLRLWGSFVIKSAQSSIYFMGDSGYSPHFKEIGTFFPSLDYAILGVGAYQPRYIMQSSHINPEEAYQAFIDLGAKHLIPMHYGTFILSDEPLAEPITKTRNLFKDSPDSLVEISIGQVRYLCPLLSN